MPESLLERTFTFCEEHKPACRCLYQPNELNVWSQVQSCGNCREATKQAARFYAASQAKKGFPRPDQGKWWWEFQSGGSYHNSLSATKGIYSHHYGPMSTCQQCWEYRLKQYTEAGYGS